ncbi:NfeD family protein [Nocardioides sp. SLBN-35]|jgi:membrane protein implicated in regulation of membrane protease activity|uniref:NfeD family protein n=1 Tax=Nocardioides sp. SLBN-35 TaxID=2768445 RepID=UPI001150FFED|nr:NfeD family protein [Nocardioides sp. SLBN-35]TQK71028.1 membrane protein implicated in regulation of membrane protease activity [Nocardioides sp. SLBN-35]
MDWLRDHLWETWLGVGIALALAELLSLDLFLLMLAGGAVAGSLTALVTDNVVVTVLVASAAAVALLAGVRPQLVRRLHGGPDLVLGPASLVGSRGIVTEPVAEHRPGRVKIGGESWLAVAEPPEGSLAVGEAVEVVSIVGATAHVRPVSDPQIEEPR